MDTDKVTCFYRYNNKTGKFEYNHYEDGWKSEPSKVWAESWKWQYAHEYKVGTSISTNGIFK